MIEFCSDWLAKQAAVALLRHAGCTYLAAPWRCGRATGSCTACFLQPTVDEGHTSASSGELPELLCNDIRTWVWRWLTALFLQYVEDRCDLRGLLGTASSVLLNISIA